MFPIDPWRVLIQPWHAQDQVISVQRCDVSRKILRVMINIERDGSDEASELSSLSAISQGQTTSPVQSFRPESKAAERSMINES
jgi:hypothetical protein